MSAPDQPARKKNIEAITNYFRRGIKQSSSEAIGIELEHTLVKSDSSPVSYDEGYGQHWLLEELVCDYPSRTTDENGSLIGLASQNATVTLEPAGQLELSAGPFKDLKAAKECFEGFEHKVNGLCNAHDIDVLTPGYHPTRKASELELIPKKRYEIMNEYLGAISMYGICMMRGSASSQVSIDFTSESDCIRKIRLASAIAPILALICDNSPIFEELPREHQLVRTNIWLNCDPDRCNTVPNVMDKDFTLEDYAEYILDTPAMVAQDENELFISNKTFGELFANKAMDTHDIEHALSMFFNDVRLKTYIEIRPADAMPVEYVIAYAALLKGLFYNEDSLAALDSLFDGISAKDIYSAKVSLMAHGYDARIYNCPVSEYADELISIASLALTDEDLELMEPMVSLVSKRTTLAQIALD